MAVQSTFAASRLRSLPQPGATWNPRDQARRDELLLQADEENYKKNRNIVIPNAQLLIMQSPDGTWWKVTVSNSGVLTTASTTHP
jgi:hypothetical protein